MWRVVALASALAATAFGGVAAQAPNPVMQHYRAYEAALEANDLATAEREAGAALAASEARNGGGGSTAALALNLANVQLDRGRGAQALSAAQRAFALSGAGGVDPVAASLALGRAELAANRSGGRLRLRTAIAEANRRGGFAEEAYAAAMALGASDMEASHAVDAERAFAAAVGFAQGEEPERKIARADALVAQGMAQMVSEELDLSDAEMSRRVTTSAAERAFGEALRLTRSEALQGAPDGALTNAQIVYARATAWEELERARLSVVGRNLAPIPDRTLVIDAEPGDNIPPCPFTVRKSPPAFYANRLRWRMLSGSAAVVRLRTDAEGQTVEGATVALAGGADMGEAIDAVAPRWTAIFASLPPRQCSRAAVILFPISFYVGEDR